MTEETPGFEQEPDVPAEPGEPGEQPGDAAQASGPAEEAGPEAAPGTPGASGDAERVAALTAQLDQTRTALNERTQDLQRLQAEFSNYRRRVERDRVAVKEIAIANVLTELLPVLDDIGRARDHGELVGGFKSVAESLETVVAKMGLQQFGKEGEAFDPTVHEALMHSYSPDVTETTCVQILQPGYRIGERTIRPARVGVAEPQPGAQPAKGEDQQAETAADEESGGPEQG
ncbi:MULTISPECIES: nucleotide exchange factor GrpE [Streptomyces]|uniref:Protein GrpE n=1 Tax=Streptomyces radiopugnans TaxID=403935 RepID=A0A1H9JZC9_9ACTN|nr:nucleotide exchange factor GrpE [Streptomyces radiopugnans]URN12544.1 nucleotide exchange factor GrpE [Streptomyces radiopugnans]SEQ91885.1 molecular chaperone GrpE [Streptomyces radiopugnans]